VTAGRARLAAHLLAGAALVLEVLALLLLIPQLRSGDVYLDENTIGGFVLGATFPVVGWLIATRRPGNAMGWIFIVIGLSQALDTFAGQYGYVGLVTAPGSLPAADVLAWVAVWAWVPGFAPLVTLAVLLFPDGRPPSARWRPVIPLVGFAMLLLAIPVAIVAWPARGADLLGEGPVPSTDPTIGALLGLQLVGLIVLAVASLLSVLGMLARFRRSRDAERAQLKWFVTAAVIEVGLLVMSGFVTLPSDQFGSLLTIVVTPLLPIAATVAILRYRLYEIDRIISRTIGWAVVTGTLVVVFIVAVITFEALLSSFAQQQTIAVAASTLVAFGVFQPVRRRVQRAVDRRFDRNAYDRERIADAFAERLRDEVAIDALAADLESTVKRAVRPSAQSMWLRRAAR
jgi:MFS family permease